MTQIDAADQANLTYPSEKQPIYQAISGPNAPVARRTGLLAKKVGMTQRFEGNAVIPVTVLEVADCRVIGLQKLEDSQSYAPYSLIVGAGIQKESRIYKSQRGYCQKHALKPFRISRGFRVKESDLMDLGSVLSADYFVKGQKVDISGVTIGKGFQGVMKRHNFGGLRASHGVSIRHRSPGSTGQRQDPGKVFKGKKMAGRMGGERVTVRNLVVVGHEANLLLVKGCIPGAKGAYVEVRDGLKAIKSA